MENLKHFNNDGANYKAQMILAYLRNYAEQPFDDNGLKYDYGNCIEVARYDNCREQGYIFTLNVHYKQRHYAVYEHRNSDEIIVLISTKQVMHTPSVDDMWADKGENATKYDYDKDFAYNEVMDACEWIIDDMTEAVRVMEEEHKKKLEERKNGK